MVYAWKSISDAVKSNIMIEANPIANDPLANALMKMKLKGFVSGALDIGGNWAVDFPAWDGFRLSVIQKGECWLSVEGHRKKIELKTGDCFLMTGGKSYSIASDLSLKKRFRHEDIFATIKNGIATFNGGGDFFSMTAIFEFEGHLPKIVLGQLPSVIHIPENLDQAAVLRWSIERFSSEFRGNNIGRPLILNHLAPVMLLQVLRIYLASAKKEKNWLTTLSDPKLSKTIQAMQTHYKRNWSLDDLAKTAGMSRSGFALNFKKQVGVAPMDYLTNWRMQIACDLLQSGKKNIEDVANSVGYASASAFSVAFKKITDLRPGAYQKSLTAR
jgi:AraC-like DNA-binding protein